MFLIFQFQFRSLLMHFSDTQRNADPKYFSDIFRNENGQPKTAARKSKRLSFTIHNIKLIASIEVVNGFTQKAALVRQHQKGE